MAKFQREQEDDAHVMPESDEINDFDKLIGAEVILPKDGIEMQAGHVVGRVCDKHV